MSEPWQTNWPWDQPANSENVMAAPLCEHHYGSHVRGGEPLSVRICTLCGAIDWADLCEQHEAAATARAERAEAALADVSAAYRTAAEVADRFRDVVSQALGLAENPGDDELVRQLLATTVGVSVPESTRWRDFIGAAKAELQDAGFRFAALDSTDPVEDAPEVAE